MNDSPNSLTPDFDAEDASLQEHRREAAKMTRWFLFAAAPFALMLVVVIAAFAWNMQRDGKGAVQAAVNSAAPVIAPATATPAAPTDSRDSEINRLRGELAALRAQTVTGSAAAQMTAPGAAVYADPNTLAQISARLDRVEAHQRAMARAAATVTAAIDLQQAAGGDAPFLAQLAAVETSVGDPAVIALLRPHAQTGVPSLAALATEFPAAARLAHTAGLSRNDKSLLGGLGRFFGNFISIRRTDAAGDDPDSLLYRAEVRLAAGDLRGAIAYLNQLPSAAQSALSPWMDRAQARLSVDDATQRLARNALAKLAVDEVTPAMISGGVL